MSILKRPDQILYEIDERPPLGMTLLLALTHVAIIFDAVVFIPNVLGKVTGAGPEQIRFSCFVTILVSAVGTLIQVVKMGRLGTGFILFMGSYSAFLACSIDAARMGGLALVCTLTVLSVPVVWLFSYFFRLFRHIVTPAVGGAVIMLVAVSLIPIGLDLWQGGDPNTPGFGSIQYLGVGGITMTTLLALMIFGTRTVRLWTPLIGLAAGYLAAQFFGMLELHHFHSSPLIGMPGLYWPGLVLDFNWGYLPLLIAFVTAALAGSIEGTGNIMLVQTVSRRDKKISYDRIQSGLYCDGLGKLLSGLGGGAPISTYCDNIPLVEMTGVASKAVGIAGAILLGGLAFVPKAGALILDMPSPVMGGMLIAIAAMLMYSGVGLVMASGLNNQTGLVFGISICVGMVAESGVFFADLIPVSLAPLLKNGVAMGGLTAFVMSALVHMAPMKKISFSVPAVPESMPEVKAALEEACSQFKFDPGESTRLELACEEMFMHLVGKIRGEDHTVLIKLVRVEQGIFVELIIGDSITDVVNVKLPSNLSDAGHEETEGLGMLLLSQIARELREIRISGMTYISFIV